MATCSVIEADIPEKNEAANTQKIKSIIVNFGVFFDGTNNQRLQVATGMIRRNKESGKKVEKIKKKIEALGGIFDEEQFKKNGNIQYYFKNKPSANNESDIKKLNKTIAKYNAKYGNRLDDEEAKNVESFAWDMASGAKNGEESNYDALEKRSGFRVGMSRSFMQNVDFTNIARLEPLYKFSPEGTSKNPVYSYRIYVTGSGTFANVRKGSDVTGLSAGQNSAGVVQKVKDALDAISQTIDKIKSNDNIKHVDYKINVFGFSRGATEARLFVDLCSKVRTKRHPILTGVIKEYNQKFINNKSDAFISFPKLGTVEFPFVGIFDTVSSVGIINPGLWNGGMGKVLRTVERVTPATSDFHEDNKKDLGLDSLVYDENVKSIVHICALDEYRENFALQVLHCSNKVEQFFIPGIHTDIGGGDLEGYAEEKLIPKKHGGKQLYISEVVTPGQKKKKDELLEVNVSKFKKLGWIKVDGEDMMADIVEENDEIIKLQKYVKRGYTYLPLNIMAEKAKKHTCSFDTIKNKYSISGKDEKGKKVLPSNFDEMKKIWKGSESVYGHCYYPKEKDKYKVLRQQWLHFSSSINKTVGLAIVNGPNITDSSDNADESKVPYYDRFLDYHPKGWYGKITESGIKDITFEDAGNQNDDDYLGEAVVVFERLSHAEEYKNKKCNAPVTVYGINGKIMEAKGATRPWNKEKSPIAEGVYYAYQYDMPTSIYGTRGPEIRDIAYNIIIEETCNHLKENQDIADLDINKVVKIVAGLENINEGDDKIKSLVEKVKNKVYTKIEANNEMKKEEKKFVVEKIKEKKKIRNRVARAKTYHITLDREHKTIELPKSNDNDTVDGIFLHRTNNDGDPTSASEGCLIISATSWSRNFKNEESNNEYVEDYLADSKDILIYVKDSSNSSTNNNQTSTK